MIKLMSIKRCLWVLFISLSIAGNSSVVFAMSSLGILGMADKQAIPFAMMKKDCPHHATMHAAPSQETTAHVAIAVDSTLDPSFCEQCLAMIGSCSNCSHCACFSLSSTHAVLTKALSFHKSHAFPAHYAYVFSWTHPPAVRRLRPPIT